jgi:hypothetical protein
MKKKNFIFSTLAALFGLFLMLTPFLGNSLDEAGGKWVLKAPQEWENPNVCPETPGKMCAVWVPDPIIE